VTQARAAEASSKRVDCTCIADTVFYLANGQVSVLSSQANDKGGYDKPRSSLQYTVNVAAMIKAATICIGGMIAINAAGHRDRAPTRSTRARRAPGRSDNKDSSLRRKSCDCTEMDICNALSKQHQVGVASG